MNQKLHYFLVFLLFCTSLAFGQNAGIRGQVKTSDGHPAEWVTIGIRGTSKGAVTGKNGSFQIKNLAPGTYTITATSVGLENQEQAITINAGEQATADFELKESAAELNEVIVPFRRAEQVNVTVAKMPLKNLENPQVYNSVSTETMKQQAITSYDDALRNVPGISRTWESTGRAGDGGSYFALRGFDAQPSLINGLPGLTSGNLDLADVAEIQVIKGPSATLFGGSTYSYGGMINTVTKKPYFDFGGAVAYNIGSFGLNRVTADVNVPLSKTEKIALRLNTAYHTENSFQDAGFRKSFFIAPALTYEVNDRLSFQLLTEILQEERAVAPVFFHSDRVNPLLHKDITALSLDNRQSFMNNSLTMKNPRFNLQAQMLYKFSDEWSSQTVISRGSVQSNGYYTYIWDEEYGDNYFNQLFQKERQTTTTTDIQQNFNGDFKIGTVRNRLLVGLDFFNRNAIDNGTGWASVRHVTPQQAEVAYIDPATGDTTAPVYLSQALVDNALAATGGSKSNVSNSSYSAYVADVINITPSLNVMAGLRADYFVSKGERGSKEDDFNQFALSPKLGIVYQPVLDKVSLFANYMNAFVNVSPQSVADADGSNPRIKSFKPEHANQWEAGVKTNLFSGKVSITASYYDIRVADRVYPDPANPNNSIQGGEVGSKGFEFDLTAHPVAGLDIIAGYSHNETKILAGNTSDFYNEPGRAPGGQGPADQANFWASYRFMNGAFKNFGLGIGGNYAGTYKVVDNSVTGVFNLPSYILLNAGLSYNTEHYRLAFNLNNITNKEYYIGYWSVNPQRPRNFTLSFAYKFGS